MPSDNNQEMFPVVDEQGNITGAATRGECHSGSRLLHPVVHLHIFNTKGELYLQKRPEWKDIQPGKWDTAVGGHLASGEDYETGARRELAEELGWKAPVTLRYLFDAQIRNEIESEDTRVFGVTLAGPFEFQREEIDEVRFWSADELKDPACHSFFTPNLVTELQRLFDGGFL